MKSRISWHSYTQILYIISYFVFVFGYHLTVFCTFLIKKAYMLRLPIHRLIEIWNPILISRSLPTLQILSLHCRKVFRRGKYFSFLGHFFGREFLILHGAIRNSKKKGVLLKTNVRFPSEYIYKLFFEKWSFFLQEKI